MAMKKNSKIDALNGIYSAVFSIVILILLISFISSSGLSLSTISTNFRWRKSLIEMYTAFRFKIGDRLYSESVVGKDGWIFYTGDRSMGEYQRTDSFRKKKLSDLQKNLNRLDKDLRKKGITLIVVIPPDKSSIYPQYMPGEIPVVGEESRLDQFVEFMKLKGEVTVVDLRQTLLNASRLQYVYFKTDTHWNDIGAYYGYREIMKSLSSNYPNLQPHPLSDFEYRHVDDSTRDIPLLMGFQNFKEENRRLFPKFKVDLDETSPVLPYGADSTRVVTNGDTRLPRLLVFHDSFYRSLAHFIEPHFSRVMSVPWTDKAGVWSLDWIQRENPNIVIIEVVERYLDNSLPELFDNQVKQP
jgi:alginate O-acetyltransferase complex protein AlgJ